MSEHDRFERLGAAFGVALVSGLLLLAGGDAAWEAYVLQTRGVAVAAVVRDRVVTDDVQKLVVEWEIAPGETTRELLSVSNQTWLEADDGAVLEVVYDPEDPDLVVIGAPQTPLAAATPMLGMLGTLLVVGLAMFVAFTIISGRQRRAHARGFVERARREEAQDRDSAYARAVVFYKEAVEAGNIDAMIGLAGLREAGRGGPQDLAAAIVLYRRAAAAGDRRGVEALERLCH